LDTPSYSLHRYDTITHKHVTQHYQGIRIHYGVGRTCSTHGSYLKCKQKFSRKTCTEGTTWVAYV